MQRSGVDQSGLFSDKYARQRSLPTQTLHPASVAHHHHHHQQATRYYLRRASTSPHVSLSSYPPPPLPETAGSDAKPLNKRPSSASRCNLQSTKISQLRQQSLPPSLPKSRSAGSCNASAGSKTRTRTSSNPQHGSKSGARQNAAKLMQSGPSLTDLHLRRGQRLWQQSIPSKSSPKQPLLERRQSVITNQKCVRRGTIQQRRSFSDCPVRADHDIHSSHSRKACCSSEIEITQVHFELEKQQKVERRRSSFSTVCSTKKEAEANPSMSYSRGAHRQKCSVDPSSRPRRSIEVHIPTSSSTYEYRSHSECDNPAHQSLTEDRFNSKSNLKRDMSKINKTTSFIGDSDDGMVLQVSV